MRTRFVPPPPRLTAPWNPDRSDAGNLHPFARISGGNFIHEQDELIPWSSTIDLSSDIRLCIGPGAIESTNQLHPAYVSTTNRGKKVAQWSDNNDIPSAYLDTLPSGTVAVNPSDSTSGSTTRIKRVLVPGTADKYCWLQRLVGDLSGGNDPLNYVDDPSSAGAAIWRNEIGDVNYYEVNLGSVDAKLINHIPRDVEIWGAAAYMWGDDLSWPNGLANEDWNDWPSGERVCGFQFHEDNDHGGFAPSSIQNGAPNETSHDFFIRTTSPTTNGQTVATHVLTTSSGLKVDEIFRATGFPMRVWNICINMRVFSTDPTKARSMVWWLPSGTPYSAMPVPSVDTADAAIGPVIAAYRNTYGHGPRPDYQTAKGFFNPNWGFLDAGGNRQPPDTPTGGPFWVPASMYGYNASSGISTKRWTQRAVPLTWCYRPPWLGIRAFAGLLHLGLLRSVGL